MRLTSIAVTVFIGVTVFIAVTVDLLLLFSFLFLLPLLLLLLLLLPQASQQGRQGVGHLHSQQLEGKVIPVYVCVFVCVYTCACGGLWSVIIINFHCRTN